MSFDTSGEVEIEIIIQMFERKEKKKHSNLNTQHIRSIEAIVELFTEKGNDQSPISTDNTSKMNKYNQGIGIDRDENLPINEIIS